MHRASGITSDSLFQAYKMSIQIIRTETGYRVNGKPVFKDQNGNWVTSLELSESEKRAFNEHLLSL